MNIPIQAQIELSDLADELVRHLDYGDIVELISLVDDVAGDWELTNLIYDWADAQHDQFLKDYMDFDYNN